MNKLYSLRTAFWPDFKRLNTGLGLNVEQSAQVETRQIPVSHFWESDSSRRTSKLGGASSAISKMKFSDEQWQSLPLVGHWQWDVGVYGPRAPGPSWWWRRSRSHFKYCRTGTEPCRKKHLSNSSIKIYHYDYSCNIGSMEVDQNVGRQIPMNSAHLPNCRVTRVSQRNMWIVRANGSSAAVGSAPTCIRTRYDVTCSFPSGRRCRGAKQVKERSCTTGHRAGPVRRASNESGILFTSTFFILQNFSALLSGSGRCIEI